MITPEEFLKMCQDLIGDDDGDHECVHGNTDDLMEELLEQLGYGEGIDLIRNSTRWYA